MSDIEKSYSPGLATDIEKRLPTLVSSLTAFA